MPAEVWPRITLVTPSFNQAAYIGQTIESVLSQDYPNLEYRIIDGGSTDGSIDIIRAHAAALDGWVSEPDQGQTDAIMKGFRGATGELMNWLNSDDLLRPGALRRVAQAWRETRSDLVVGRDDAFESDPSQPVSRFEPAGYAHPDCLRFWDGRFSYHQPCAFFSARAYHACGGLDPRWHYAMDYDLYCRMLALSDCRVTLLADVISAFRLHPMAKTSRAKAAFLDEQRAISTRDWPPHWGDPERRAMDAYCAHCTVFQAADAARARQPRAASRLMMRAWRFSPGQTLRTLWRQGLGGPPHVGQ